MHDQSSKYLSHIHPYEPKWKLIPVFGRHFELGIKESSVKFGMVTVENIGITFGILSLCGTKPEIHHVGNLAPPQIATYVFTARHYASMVYAIIVCLVCVSVTLRYCIKTAKHRMTRIMLHDSPGTVVFWRQRSQRNSKKDTQYGNDKCRWGGLKLVTFDK